LLGSLLKWPAIFLKHAIPEVVPLQQISYHAFAIQEIIAYASKKLEEQVLDIVNVFLLSLFSHR
jgi:hypothetical protein